MPQVLSSFIAFRAGLEQLYRMILDLGFTMTSACYPMSIEPDASDLQAVYGATASGTAGAFQ